MAAIHHPSIDFQLCCLSVLKQIRAGPVYRLERLGLCPAGRRREAATLSALPLSLFLFFTHLHTARPGLARLGTDLHTSVFHCRVKNLSTQNLFFFCCCFNPPEL